MFQSRRSLLVWKLYGERLDGFSNDDHPSESKPGARDLVQAGKPVDMKRYRAKWDLDYTGSQMPPPQAVKEGKVQPLTDEDRRTLVRWIDLGCPIDLDYDPANPTHRGYGWMLDDNRPIVTIAVPGEGHTRQLDRIVIGLHDYYTGLDADSLSVTADFEIDGQPPETNLASRFREKSPGVWEWKLDMAIEKLERGTLSVSVKDREGNVGRFARTWSSHSVGP
jgi:hypothetical protein